jgi:hypothetical protein
MVAKQSKVFQQQVLHCLYLFIADLRRLLVLIQHSNSDAATQVMITALVCIVSRNKQLLVLSTTA